MDAKDFVNKVLYVTADYDHYFNGSGQLTLVLTRYHEFLTPTQIFEYLLLVPHVYDTISSYDFDELCDLNCQPMGAYIRSTFGMWFPDNKNIDLTDDVFDENSPENVSFRVLKQIWLYINEQKNGLNLTYEGK